MAYEMLGSLMGAKLQDSVSSAKSVAFSWSKATISETSYLKGEEVPGPNLASKVSSQLLVVFLFEAW